MSYFEEINRVARPLGDSIVIDEDLKVTILDDGALSERIELVVQTSVFGNELDRNFAHWLIRTLAIKSGAIPASINALYFARGRNEVRDDFTVPAINLRTITYYAARAVFRSAMNADAKAFIFEIARSEMGYTQQPPSEYTSCVLGAAIAEGYKGPVFLQGDHFQISATRYAKNPEAELEAIYSLIRDSIAAGFYNIDIDTSTLVDLSQPTIIDQQEVNYTLSAQVSAFARELEPNGVTISLGGEIGEVGGQNSTEPELRAYMEGFNQHLATIKSGALGLSKVSVQTGTSHGGVVLPDGSIASVKVDFDTLQNLGRVAKEYGMGGAVQHGASTLPEEAFSHFVKANTLEVHLATNFQNILYDRIPEDLLEDVYSYLRLHHSDERKPDQTDDQFYYKTRKRALGPFKKEMWNLPFEVRRQIEAAWEEQFNLLFERLNIGGTRQEVEQHIDTAQIYPDVKDYLGESVSEDDVRDLAD
jgi:fructose/tagatose bisphosphate aldolase